MKKIVFFFIAFAAMFVNACQKDLSQLSYPVETDVTFILNSPEIATKSFGDGTIANDLYFGVYDAGGNLISKISKIDEPEKIVMEKEVSLRLVTGNTYSIIFWAQNKEGICSVDFAEKKMTFSPESANNEGYDAFYAYVEPFKVESDMNKKVQLYRPFAQLNIGADDIADASNAGLDVATSQIIVKTPSVLDLITGDVSEEKEFTYSYTDIPKGEKFPVAGYEYLSMNYLLVSADKTLIDVCFSYNGDDDYIHNYTNVPVQRNYRTNIFGSILTSKVNLNVVIEPAFNTPDYNYTY